MSLVSSCAGLVSGVFEKTCPGSAEGVAGSFDTSIVEGGGIGGMASLIGTTRFFFNGANARSDSDDVFLGSPIMADLVIFLGETKSSFVLFSPSGFRGRDAACPMPEPLLADTTSFSMRLCLGSLMTWGFSALSLSAIALATLLSVFSSPNFLLEPAFRI